MAFAQRLFSGLPGSEYLDELLVLRAQLVEALAERPVFRLYGLVEFHAVSKEVVESTERGGC